MRPVLFTLTLLAATASLAQAPTHAVVNADTFSVVQVAGCPVGIFASRQSSPATVWTTSLDDLQPNKPVPAKNKYGTGVHVDLTAQRRQIQQAELDVFFLPTGARALPVKGSQFAPSSALPSETSKKFSLASASTSQRLDGDLLLGPVASITRVSLMRLTFTDGSVWTAQNSASCSVEPSKFMLVQAK